MKEKLNPRKMLERMKMVYRPYALVLPLKFKVCILSVIAILLLDNLVGISYTIMINSRIDTIAHMLETKPQMAESYLIGHKRLLAYEYIHHKTVLEDIVDFFKLDKEISGKIPVVNTISSAILFFFFMALALYYIIKLLIIGHPSLYHHLSNLLLALFTMSLIAYLIHSLTLEIPEFIGGWYVNYGVYAMINLIVLGFLLLFLPTIPENQNTEASVANNVN